MPSTSSGGICSPSSLPRRPSRSVTRRGSAGRGYSSSVPGTSRAPQTSSISLAASRWAAMAWSGWSCFSKRALASVRRPRLAEVRRMFEPTHVAASIKTRVVLLETSEI